MQETPGILFREGPTRRRAAAPEGPDVWEVAAVPAQQAGSPEKRLTSTAIQLGLSIGQIETAATYWAAHRAEIGERIAANIEAADRELTAWEQQQALLEV